MIAHATVNQLEMLQLLAAPTIEELTQHTVSARRAVTDVQRLQRSPVCHEQLRQAHFCEPFAPTKIQCCQHCPAPLPCQLHFPTVAVWTAKMDHGRECDIADGLAPSQTKAREDVPKTVYEEQEFSVVH